MKDRVPTPGKEGRVRLRQDNGQILEGVLEMADEPLEIGTPLTKATLLQDATAAILGLTGDPTVNDALLALLLVTRNMALVRATVTVPGAPAVSGIEITGIEVLNGGAVYIDASGSAVGFAHTGEVYISTPTYQDLPAAQTVKLNLSAGDIADVDLTINSAPKAGDKSITSSVGGIRFSPYVTGVDVCCIGGGGGGTAGNSGSLSETSYSSGGDGGEQGVIVNSMNVVPDPKKTYSAVVGVAGIGGYGTDNSVTKDATDGGSSSFLGVTAAGGRAGGAGNGAYWSFDDNTGRETRIAASSGKANTTRILNDASIPLTGGDGGGSGCLNEPDGTSGASPSGGAGAEYRLSSVCSGAKGGSYGAGGGGGFNTTSNDAKVGGDGYQGLIRYRWRVV